MSYPQHQVIYQQVVRPPSKGMAVTSLVLGIVAIVTGIWTPIPIIGLVFAFFAFLPAVLAVVFGHVGLIRSRAIGVGRGAALTGLVLGYVTVGVIVATTLVWILALGAASASQPMS